MKRLLAFCVLAACTTERVDLMHPIGGEFVSFGNAGSITGGGLVTSISPNNVMVVTRRVGDTHGATQDWAKLPDGTFDAMQALAREEIKKLEGQVFPNNCMDAGTDRIFVRDAAGVEHEARSICPGTAVAQAQTYLRSELSRLQFPDGSDPK